MTAILTQARFAGNQEVHKGIFDEKEVWSEQVQL
jgi:hypothetical protein